MKMLKIVTTVAAGVLLVVSLSGCQLIRQATEQVAQVPVSIEQASDPAVAGNGIVVELIRVVDGDTIAIAPTAELPATNQRGTEHHVRVLSIDAPEMNKMEEEPAECGAQEATDHLASMLHGHAEVSLLFDPVSDRTDRFGRSLAYVQTLDNPAVDVGLEQVRAGFAEAWYPRSEPAPSRFDAYRELAREAQASSAGSFGSCASVGR